jgi:hypothetical protein
MLARPVQLKRRTAATVKENTFGHGDTHRMFRPFRPESLAVVVWKKRTSYPQTCCPSRPGLPHERSKAEALLSPAEFLLLEPADPCRTGFGVCPRPRHVENSPGPGV